MNWKEMVTASTGMICIAALMCCMIIRCTGCVQHDMTERKEAVKALSENVPEGNVLVIDPEVMP